MFFVIFSLYGCIISSIGVHRDASPIGKHNSRINLRGFSNVVTYGCGLDYRYGLTDKIDISAQLLAGKCIFPDFCNEIHYGFGLSIVNQSKRIKDFAYGIHGATSKLNKIVGFKTI